MADANERVCQAGKKQDSSNNTQGRRNLNNDAGVCLAVNGGTCTSVEQSVMPQYGL